MATELNTMWQIVFGIPKCMSEMATKSMAFKLKSVNHSLLSPRLMAINYINCIISKPNNMGEMVLKPRILL